MALADRIFRLPVRVSASRKARPSDALLNPRQRALKRAFDLSLASVALLALSPLLLLMAIMVKISSRGPVIYRHRRVGQGGGRFDVLKYRTMVASDTAADWEVTVAGDTRVTPLGRRLRSAKFDELPQLWNVIRGEMSLVGWRPHVAGYPDRLTGRDALLIDERPGITGAATLYFRDEERLLSLVHDPKRHYDTVIYPLKVRMDLDYYRSWSLRRDLACLIVTALPPADRWLRVVPALGDLERETLEASPVAVSVAQGGADVHAHGNGYRPVVPVPVHSSGNGASPNGVPAGARGNGRGPSKWNGDEVERSAAEGIPSEVSGPLSDWTSFRLSDADGLDENVASPARHD